MAIQSLQTLRHNGYLSPTQPGLVSCNLTFDLQKSSEQKLEKGQLSNQATLFANWKLCSQSQMLQHVTYKWLPLDPLVKLKSLNQWIIVNHWVNSDSFQGPQWTWTLLLYIHVLAPSTRRSSLANIHSQTHIRRSGSGLRDYRRLIPHLFWPSLQCLASGFLTLNGSRSRVPYWALTLMLSLSRLYLGGVVLRIFIVSQAH